MAPPKTKEFLPVWDHFGIKSVAGAGDSFVLGRRRTRVAGWDDARARRNPSTYQRPHRHHRVGCRLLRPETGCLGAVPAGRVRHIRAPRVLPGRRVQRGPHRRHHPGDRRIPGESGHHRAAVHRARHARAQPPRGGDSAAGARGERGGRADGCVRAIRADPRALARDPHPQPRADHRSGRRHHHHPEPQSAPGRRLQVQPAARRTGRQRRHRMDRPPRQRPARRGQPGGGAHRSADPGHL
jgi:hypothetical protein